MSTPENEKVDLKTMVSVTNMLDKLGFTTQFKATAKGLKSLTTERVYLPEEIKVVNFYRFEGESNPDDNSIIYAIESVNGERGTLTDAYGPGSDADVTNFMRLVTDMEKKVDRETHL